VKYLVEHAGGKTIVKAMEFLNEIDAYENKSDVPESQLDKK
jgi:nitrogenase subunit NifH